MIKKLLNEIQENKITKEELKDKYLKVAHLKNKEINAYISITDDYSKIHTKNNGPLSGIPVVVKDNINIQGTITTAGSKILENYKSPYTAEIIDRMKDFTLIGKGNLDAFAFGSSTENSGYKVTKNPYDLSRVAGGSSGGVAAAVAMGSAVFGIGTDTGGSVRQPASFCNLVGLKPTYGLCSRYGLIAMASSFDTPGIIALDTEDMAYVLNVIAGFDPKDSTSCDIEKQDYTKFKDIKGLRVGVLDFDKEGVDNDVLDNFDRSINILKDLGCKVDKMSLKYFKYALPVYYVLVPAEISSNLTRFDGIRFGIHPTNTNDLSAFYMEARDKFEDEVKKRILIGTYTLSKGYFDAYYNKALKVRNLIKKEFVEKFKDFDVIITPTTPTGAFKIGEKKNPLSMYLSDIFTVIANVIGIPAISVPNGKTKENLPTGLHIMGNFFEEEKLLSLANKFEKTLS